MENAKPSSLKKVFLFLLLLLFLNALAVVAVLWLALSKEMPSVERQNTMALISVATKLNGLPEKIKKALPDDVEQLSLPEKDVNALLAAGFAATPPKTKEGMPFKALSLKFNDGIGTLHFTKELGFNTPFGNKVNMVARFKAEYTEEKGLTATLLKFKAGRLSIPLWLLQWPLDQALKRSLAKPEAEDFKRAVLWVKNPPGSIDLRYKPYELQLMINEKLTDPLMKGVWNSL